LWSLLIVPVVVTVSLVTASPAGAKTGIPGISVGCGDVTAFENAVVQMQTYGGGPINLNVDKVANCVYTFPSLPAIIEALPKITSAVWVNGGGSTLRRGLDVAGGSIADFRAFTVDPGGALTLQNLTIDGFSGTGGTGGGGAILNSGTTNLTDVALINNTTDTNGGALRNRGTARLTRVTVSDNSATGGGGIANGAQGGTIGNAGNGSPGTLIVVDSTIVRNSAVAGGGGISNYFGTVRLTRSRVDANHAGSNYPNSTQGSGGGIDSVGATATLTLDSTSVSSNTAARGGGIHTDGFAVTIATHSTINSNEAILAGGGIDNNSGAGPYPNLEFLGSLVVLDATVVSFNKTTFQGLPKDLIDVPKTGGGGIWSDGRLIVVNNSQIGYNQATDNHQARTAIGELFNTGGGIYVGRTGRLTVLDSTVRNNTADDYGGGVEVEDGAHSAAFFHSWVLDNTSQSWGGGIHAGNIDAGLVLFNSQIDSNTAQGGGGGISVSGPLVLQQGSVTNNTASVIYGGGGIYQGGGTSGAAFGTAFAGNTPDNCGGGGTVSGCP